MKRFLVLFTILTIALVSCKDPAKKESGSDLEMKQVMEVHDAVMPKMGEMGKLVAELKTKEDTTDLGQQYAEARMKLQQAHTSMMEWMQEFGDRFTSDEILNGTELSEEKKQWLKEEDLKIHKVADEINTSIAEAKALLGKE